MFDLSFLQTLSEVVRIDSLGLNFLDILAIILLFLYAFEGYSLGFLIAFIDLMSFILSFVLGLLFYDRVGEILFTQFSLSRGFSNAIGFLTVAAVSEVIISILLRVLSRPLAFLTPPKKYAEILPKINRFFGILPGFLSGLILLSFVLTLLVSLPLSPYLKRLVAQSKIGLFLVSKTSVFDTQLSSVFGGAIHDTLSFLTVEPQSDESVKLNFTTKKFSVDSQAEVAMLALVNRERATAGVPPLTMNEELISVARAHSMDMLRRGYFSHYTPEGLSPFDRMAKANIQYQYAGENLALAPDVNLAMEGLMQSPGHRANILSPNFRKIGIGAIDAGIYGEMFTQEFTD